MPNPCGYAPFSLRDDSALRHETVAALRDRAISVALGDGMVIPESTDMRHLAADIEVMVGRGSVHRHQTSLGY